MAARTKPDAGGRPRMYRGDPMATLSVRLPEALIAAARAAAERRGVTPTTVVRDALIANLGTDGRVRGLHRAAPVRTCESCGCTDDDCSGCIARTGQPCTWSLTYAARGSDVCSACVSRAKAVPSTGRRR